MYNLYKYDAYNWLNFFNFKEEENLNLSLIKSKSENKEDDANDLNTLKIKYNNENETELRQLEEKELNSLLNSLKIESDETKTPLSNNTSNNKEISCTKPSVNRSLKPKSSNEQNNYNLRTISVPYDLAKKFQDVAEANTKRNIEVEI